MRFTSSAILALPLLAAAAESPFDQYKAKFQNFLSSFGAAVGAPSVDTLKEPLAAAKAKVGAKKVEVLTLDNWKDTLYAPVKPEATIPEEWWMLVTGGNKSCFGRCAQVEQAFNETVAKFATLSKPTPHVAYLDCDNEPILCNAWSASTGALWVFEMLPAPAPIDVYWRRLNLTTTTSQDLLDLQASGSKDSFHLIDGYFHPFDGVLAKNNVAVPLAYALWGLNAVPSWAMMLIVSFLSRTLMNRRVPGGGHANPGAAPAGAPPGDARS
ncbi:hypothetical protein B0T17DRAFT_586306 [Bombardia bombarda]|uniref:Peptidyl-tRNA hydrolase n=1 Tax=Bombardia bombarda TaxID=252184 RepID=A0AA40CEJ7_9PEZI|nr:hypothetical protein B0T17DRAFT_586306 [Bombardia bombarda]